MRFTASEKAEIIELVEQSHLPAKRTLDKAANEFKDKTTGIN